MESGFGIIGRNPVVCARMKCRRCNDLIIERSIPDECEYGILHFMEREMDKKWDKRQSGKTTYLLKAAVDLSERFGVYYISRTLTMCEIIRKNGKMRHGDRIDAVRFMSLGQIRNGSWRGVSSGLVLLDEVRPGEVEKFLVPRQCFPIVAARWT